MEKNVCYTWLGSLWIYLYNFLKFSEARVSHCCLITLVQLFSNRHQCPIPSSREWGFILSFHKPSLPRAAASISETFAVPFSGRVNSTLKYLSKLEHILPIPTVHESVCVLSSRENAFSNQSFGLVWLLFRKSAVTLISEGFCLSGTKAQPSFCNQCLSHPPRLYNLLPSTLLVADGRVSSEARL